MKVFDLKYQKYNLILISFSIPFMHFLKMRNRPPDLVLQSAILQFL